MYNVTVKVFGTDQIPTATPSYSNTRWSPIEDFLKMVETKDPEILHSLFGNRSVHYCVQGLCLASAYLHLKGRL